MVIVHHLRHLLLQLKLFAHNSPPLHSWNLQDESGLTLHLSFLFCLSCWRMFFQLLCNIRISIVSRSLSPWTHVFLDLDSNKLPSKSTNYSLTELILWIEITHKMTDWHAILSVLCKASLIEIECFWFWRWFAFPSCSTLQ
jgi:hypothetical protein